MAASGAARALARRGTDVIGVSALHRRPPGPGWTPPVPVVPLPLPRIVLYESWHRLRAPRVQRATGEVDVVHATSLAVPPRRPALVVTVHDLAFLHEPAMFTRRGVSFLRRGLQLTRAEADLVVCPSEASARDCEAAGIERARLRVVPLGVEARPVDAEEVRAVRRRYGIERSYVLWTGTLEPRKNLARVLEAWARLRPDADLVLAGPRGWDRAVTPPEDVAGIHLVGFVPARDLHALYAGARLLLWPSLLEGFGFPVLEAMSHGIPVITSAGTSTEEVAGDAALLVDPRDVDAIAAAVARLLQDDTLATELGRRGLRRAAGFTWERTAEGLDRVYGELA